ncbi:FAD-dependent monooxygenase [Amycolatopsis sp. NPDC059021]|uniref:FAD-dependent monooxygenase n=1 Tax=Amycolatopsis sp. NPDC059021 TaxID=3346704 RepID=UPI00366B8933
MDVVETDVLVIGGGPVGLTASALLAAYGVDAITVSKHASTSPNPRAHYINQRTMEIFRNLGFEERVHEAGTPVSALGSIVWALSFAGRELARKPAWGTGQDRIGEYEATSPCGIWNVPQHFLEPVLLDAAREAGADIRFGTEAVELSAHEDHVLVTVRERQSGAERRIRARYVIGADGARSTVAEQAGFEYELDTGVLNWAANVWLEADLTDFCAHRPGMLYWMHAPGAGFHSSSAWICVRPWTEWVMALVYPSSRAEPHVDEETALAHARRTIGDPSVDVRIKAINPWSVGAALAGDFRRGRVFLAGDSAHRHPPPNGLGINTGVQDAFNLCWKLAMVLAGTAGDGLLDSYRLERQPVARAVIDRAMTSLADMDPLLAAFGVQHGQSAEEGWARLDALTGDGEIGGQRRRELYAALRLQDGQFNGHNAECGQYYRAGAVFPDDGAARAPEDYRQVHHHPRSLPGHPLPHAWVERGRTVVSTIDIAGRGGFTVLTGLGGTAWASAARQASATLGIPVEVANVDYQGEYHDVYGDWARVRDLDESGCLLVRPDRHIAWRAEHAGGDPARALTEVLRGLLSRS